MAGNKLLSVIGRSRFCVVFGKSTSECFTDPLRYSFRDPRIDKFLPSEQPKMDMCFITALSSMESASFLGWATNGILGVSLSTPIGNVVESIKKADVTFSLPQIEEIIESSESGLQRTVLVNGRANFFFVDGEKDIFIISASRDNRKLKWDIDITELQNGVSWKSGCRIFIRQHVNVSGLMLLGKLVERPNVVPFRA